MFTEVCTCCGATFEEDVPQEIGEELCQACIKAIINGIEGEDDDSPLEFDPAIYEVQEFHIDFDELNPEEDTF